MPKTPPNISTILDEQGRVIQWPARPKVKQEVLDYLLEKVEVDKKYSEREINVLLDQYHLFNDAALLRREMIGRRMLKRTRDCTAYWKEA